jgi:hypothetical protein
VIEPQDPDAVRRSVQELLAEPRYSYEPSLLERAVEWLAEQLGRLLPDGGGPGGSFGGGIGALVAWVLIVAAAVAAVVIVVAVLRGRTRRPPTDDGPLSETQIEHRRSARDWDEEAARHEAEGNWKEAVRARYRFLVRTLVDRGQLPDLAGRTTGELRADLAVTTPSAAADFESATRCFELIWYAGAPAGRGDAALVAAAAGRVLDAVSVDRFDGAEPASRRIAVGAGAGPGGPA